LKVFSILSSLIILIPFRTSTYACGWYPDREEIRFMMFNPDLVSHESWWNFFYSARYNYGDGQYRSADDEEQLVREWKSYTRSKVEESEIHECLFGSLSDSALQLNPFYGEIIRSKALEQYFNIAHESEAVSLIEWTFDNHEVPERRRQEKRLDLMERIGEILPKIEDSFMKRKYAFQLLKLAFYANDETKFNTIYDQFFKGKENHVLDWWAMHYKAVKLEGASVDSANFLHARVFSNSSNKQYASRQWFSRARLDTVLALARDDRARADVLLLSEVINPGRSLEGIVNVYQLAPRHPQLPLLISREVNKLEDWLGSTRYINIPSLQDPYGETPVMSNWQRDFEYLGSVTAEIEKMDDLKAGYPEFYNLTLAYLHLMKGDAAAGISFLDRVKASDPSSEFQRDVLKILYLTQLSDIRQDSVQAEIGDILESLFVARRGVFESQKMLYSLTAFLRHEFANKGMIHFAGLFSNYSVNKFCSWCALSYPQGWPASFEYSMIEYLDLYGKPSDVQGVIDTYEKTKKNKLEQVLMRPYSNAWHFYDLLGTLYLREGKLSDAAIAFHKIPDSFWPTFINASENLVNDPFVNPELLETETMMLYNKRETVDRMLALESQIKTDPMSRAKNNRLLGNAWFNFSAKSWFMIAYRFTEAQTYPVSLGEYATAKAKRYYRDALSSERDPEMRSKLIYMAAYLSEGNERKTYAKQFEELGSTTFYARRNCLTLRDLAAN
jgi:hypothetical protein